MTNADTPWPMKTSPTAEDYIATLATQVLLQAGCDHLPVNAVNLLRLVRQRDGSSRARCAGPRPRGARAFRSVLS